MNWDRKGVLLMLVVVAFWAAIPATACLLAARQSSQPVCCHSIGDCNSMKLAADSSCCQMRGTNPAVTPVPPYSPEQAQRLALLSHQDQHVAEQTAAPGAGYASAFETPSPKSPPGGAFALRI
jgi:hypothetical protein